LEGRREAVLLGGARSRAKKLLTTVKQSLDIEHVSGRAKEQSAVAKVVQAIGITHNPLLAGLLRRIKDDAVLNAAIEDYSLMRQKLTSAKPDILVVVASDHLNQWFMDNMPAFIIGKARTAAGPFPHEIESFGLSSYQAAVDVEMAKWLLEEGSRRGVDFSFSDEFTIDHAFTVPLNFLRPEMDLPIIPVWTNVMAPPVPVAQRFYEVGQKIRQIIEAAPSCKRIAVITSGHLAVEVGGPRPATYSSNVDFDQRMMDLISRVEVKTILEESTWEKLLEAGNVAPGFLNYVLLLGVANGAVPSSVGVHIPSSSAAIPYMAWDL
jgi:protocatechuate 4,5-dioxygenase beta chain